MVCASIVSENVPGGHAVHAVLPLVENCPVEHAMQSSTLDWRGTFEKRPPGHRMQDSNTRRFSGAEYVPAGHAVQCVVLAQDSPAGHDTQDALLGCRGSVEILPSSHDVQPRAPAYENLPAGQMPQVKLPGTSANSPPGQTWQVALDVAPEILLTLPTGQATHVSELVCPRLSL